MTSAERLDAAVATAWTGLTMHGKHPDAVVLAALDDAAAAYREEHPREDGPRPTRSPAPTRS